jgi:NitT/TauT family transport system substrate-binding protein
MNCRRLIAVIALTLCSVASAAWADDAAKLDVVKLAIGQRGNWDTAITELGTKAGIFEKYGLVLDMTYTSGSGETLQPVISGAVDAGLAVGAMGTISAFAKGAPVRIIAAEATGAADFWYAPTSSSIRTLKDTDGHTIAYSTRGSSTDSIVRAFITEFGLTAKPVATGNPAATMAAVMSHQVDVGWSSPPHGLKEMEDGKIRLVAKATEAAIVRDQTIRVIVANAQALEQRKDVFRRFMQGDSPQVIIDYAAFVGVPDSMARRVRDDFFPKSLINPDEIKGLDSLMHEAVELKFIAEPLTKEQLAQLIQLQPPITH